MNEILQAFQRSLFSLRSFKVWLRLLLPAVLAMALVLGIFIMKWSAWYLDLRESLEGGFLIQTLAWPFVWFWTAAPVVLGKIVSGVVLMIAALALSYVMSLLLLSVILIPLLVPLIVDQEYPMIRDDKKGGRPTRGEELSVISSLLNTFWSVLKFLGGFLITLPLWLIPGMAFFLALFWNGYLAGQIVPVDVLQGWATKQEIAEIRQSRNSQHLGLGLLTSMIFVIPVMNLFAPSLLALIFVHYDLQELVELRKRPSKSQD
jgi:CysZ protein